MAARCSIVVALLALYLPALAVAEPGFTSLFNGRDLSGWDSWLGAREVSTLPYKILGEWENVAGWNRDDSGVFSVVDEEGEPAIRISGEIWGALVTQGEYENYHLQLQFKWGDEKFAPRLDKPRNSGLLYHSGGDPGAFWSYWMRSVEFEIMQGSTGMLSPVDKVSARVPVRWDFSLPIPWLRYADDGIERGVGGPVFRVQASEDREYAAGRWNTLELFVFADRSVHVVNGKPVLSARSLGHDPGEGTRPLTRGKIQLQSEGAEVFFRKLRIRSLTRMPDDFSHPPGG